MQEGEASMAANQPAIEAFVRHLNEVNVDVHSCYLGPIREDMNAQRMSADRRLAHFQT